MTARVRGAPSVPSRLPKILRVEAKFTTSRSISVPKREREALLGSDREAVGVIAALFWCGKRDVDGRWFIVDAAESFRSGKTEGGSLGVQDLRRIEKNQTWLAGVREHVKQSWPPFLAAFGSVALAGHDTLLGELKDLHTAGKLGDRLGARDILELEHRKSVQAIVDGHGPSVAGHIFQDLLAYVLSLAGYRTVRINPVGVPDIEVSELAGYDTRDTIKLELSRQQVEQLVKLARGAGNAALAEKLQLRMA